MTDATTWSRLWAGIRGPARRLDPYAWRHISYWRWFAILSISALAGIAAGYRWFGYGRDYYDYLIAYAGVETTFSVSYSRFEPAYNALSWVFKTILNVEYETFTSVLIAVALTIKLYLINRYLRYAALATIVYFLFLYPLHEYTQVRVALGIAFGFWGLHLFLARRWLLGLLCFTIAILFHYTMIVFVAGMTVAVLIRNRRWVIVGTLFGLIVLALSESLLNFVTTFAGLFSPIATFYTQQVARGLLADDVNLFATVNLMLYASLISALLFRWFNEDRYRRINVLLALISVLIMVLFVTLPVFAHRLREVFAFAFILFAFRDARREIEWAPALFVFLASVVTFAAAIQDELIILW
jgi:hypothetical protein